MVRSAFWLVRGDDVITQRGTLAQGSECDNLVGKHMFVHLCVWAMRDNCRVPTFKNVCSDFRQGFCSVADILQTQRGQTQKGNRHHPIPPRPLPPPPQKLSTPLSLPKLTLNLFLFFLFLFVIIFFGRRCPCVVVIHFSFLVSCAVFFLGRRRDQTLCRLWGCPRFSVQCRQPARGLPNRGSGFRGFRRGVLGLE